MEKTSDTVIYGIHAVEELLENRTNEIDRLYFDSEQNKGAAFQLLKLGRRKKIPCQCIPAQKLNQIANTQKHQGVVALCTAKPFDSIDDLHKKIDLLPSGISPLMLIPASMEDPRNLGALIRTSVAFDVTALLLERKRTAPLTATVAKTSAGMIEHISLIKPQSLEKEVKEFREKGYSIIGSVGGGAKKPQEIDFTGPAIIIMGGEFRGLPPYLEKLCTDFVGIPMQKKVESLNVSVAASILLYECSRQRKFQFTE